MHAHVELSSFAPFPNYYVIYMQFPDWNRRFGYTVVEVKLDALHKHLQEGEVPQPLSLEKAEKMCKEGLRVNDLLYKVHYPAKPKSHIRCETADQICVFEGKRSALVTKHVYYKMNMYGHSCVYHSRL